MTGFQSDLLTAGVRIIVTQSHVTSDTRSSHFSACDIEKAGNGAYRDEPGYLRHTNIEQLSIKFLLET